MKEALKRNWKPITAFALALSAVGAAAYYVNFIYIPGKERARAAELTAAQVVPETPKEYHYTVKDISQSQGDASGTGTNPANDRITVTTDADGNVTVDRTWDAKPGELDTTTAAPGAPTANIGGGGKITGTDGAYHGEQPSVTTPSTGGATTKPSTGDSGSSNTKPSDSSTKPSTPSKPGSSSPQMGDTRVVDGKEQMYVDGFGWTDVGDGGHTDYIEMPDELSGIQVGEMG